MSRLRLAIVGAGPAGIYAADYLLKRETTFDVSIDLFERLPAPYGLVRYGVAPDHPRIKGIISALRQVLDSGKIRLFGNVSYGDDISLEDLKRHYHAVIFSTGAIEDADLRIPGVELSGSFGAAEFVSWYDGHPDVERSWPMEAQEIAVIGNGNVALDVARMIAKPANDLLPTEVPDNVFDVLASSAATDIHVFGRKGPMQVKFTPLELRELGELRDVDILLSDEDFEFDESSRQAISANKQTLVVDKIFSQWRSREVGSAKRRLHFHFYAKPIEIFGDDRVEGLRFERTEPDGEGGFRETGETRLLPAQAVYRAVGYFGSPLLGIPFDSTRGIIPNQEGQVVDDNNGIVPGVFVTGWIKRGPVGLIGHTKSDAMETVDRLVGQQESWWNPTDPSEQSVIKMMQDRGLIFTNLEGWHRLDQAELERGHGRGRERLKIVPRKEMLSISVGSGQIGFES